MGEWVAGRDRVYIEGEIEFFLDNSTDSQSL